MFYVLAGGAAVIAGGGAIFYLKGKKPKKPEAFKKVAHCQKCGAALPPDAVICPNCSVNATPINLPVQE